MKGYYIGMDVGGTHLRLKLADARRAILEECSAPGCSLNLSGYQGMKRQYGAVIRHALEKRGYTPSGCLGFCIGAAGVDPVPATATIFGPSGRWRNISQSL